MHRLKELSLFKINAIDTCLSYIENLTTLLVEFSSFSSVFMVYVLKK